MDASRFGELLRSLSVRPTRRGIGHGLAGLLLAGVRGGLDLLDVDAKKKRKRKKKCKGGKRRCGKKCILATECCGGCGTQHCCDGICRECCVDADCPTDAICNGGDCLCPILETNCGNVCADLAMDGANCGACGNACATDSCVHGACTCAIGDDCPVGCNCLDRAEGGSACAGSGGQPTVCNDDADCPLGSFCRNGIHLCSIPCQS